MPQVDEQEKALMKRLKDIGAPDDVLREFQRLG